MFLSKQNGTSVRFNVGYRYAYIRTKDKNRSAPITIPHFTNREQPEGKQTTKRKTDPTL